MDDFIAACYEVNQPALVYTAQHVPSCVTLTGGGPLLEKDFLMPAARLVSHMAV